jgi:hypothetical protein
LGVPTPAYILLAGRHALVVASSPARYGTRFLKRLPLVSGAIAVVTVTGIVSGACSTEAPASGDAMNLTAGTCSVVAMKDGHVLTAGELDALRDPVANLILKQGSCPLTLSEIQAKLAQTDPCSGQQGNVSQFVSDRAALLERPDTYRAVIARPCQQRADHELLMSVFGIRTHTGPTGSIDDVQVPENTVELIGEQLPTKDESGDPNTGVFNFYAREGGQWRFFGSSRA